MQACTIKIGTFNLFNLIKPGVNFYERDPLTEENYTKKIAWVANQLKEMDCDIVAFQEIFHSSALEEAIEKSGLYSGLKPVLIQENEKELKPKVALVSKFPILQVNFITKFPKQCDLRYNKQEFPIHEFHRPILRAVIALPNGSDLIVYAVHFKSNLSIIEEYQDRNDLFAFTAGKAKAAMMRTAEAAALRCLIIQDLKNTTNPLCVIGDFNDTIHGPINRILIGEMPYDRVREREKQALYRMILHNTYFITARRTFRDVFYTNIHGGMHEALDHILVSDEFLDENPDRIGTVEGLIVLNDHLSDFERLPKSQFYHKSDHGQVVAIISINPQRQKCNRPEEDFQKYY